VVRKRGFQGDEQGPSEYPCAGGRGAEGKIESSGFDFPTRGMRMKLSRLSAIRLSIRAGRRRFGEIRRPERGTVSLLGVHA